MKYLALGLAAMLASYPVIPPAIAADGAAADFFKSKQMQIIVGYGAGGGYDVYARLVAKHLSNHLPGQPSVIVQNMPGAGSLRAANYIYNAAPKDGSFLATFARSMVMMGMLGGNPNVQFDARKFTWLGSPSSAQDEAYMLWVRKDARAKTLEDARRPGGPDILLGGSSEGSTDTDIAVLIRNAAGVRLKVIGGYPDSNAMYLAVERGEVEGRFVGTSALSSTRPDWLKPDGPMIPLLQFARATRLPEFPDVPTAREVAKDDRARELIEMAEIPYMLSRPYVGPPDIPADRAHILQDAFLDMGKDPAFLADAKKMRVDVSPVGAKEATRMLDMLANAPQEMKDELRKMQSGG
jgi:tripartite-type tricarboxylate transporter receptor subunit TctC